MISLSPKGSTRASECIECSEKFLFVYENFQIDSNIQTCSVNKKKGKNNKRYSQYTVISENILHSILRKERGQL